jgi:hypothetical protein
MEEQTPSTAAQATEFATDPTTGVRWADLRCLVVLVLLAVGLRAWQLTHTEVASRDSITYVRMAWQLEHNPWREVLPKSPQHPGYSLAVLAVSPLFRQLLPNDLPMAWQLSAQLASALASVLLLVPMFFLGRELFDRRIAFWGCLLFQCLPTSGKVMGDGLSDTLFLLFACAGLWFAFVALRRGTWPLFALTGLAGGLAYLTRPEGALIVGATGLVLIGLFVGRRRSWRFVLGRAVADGAGADGAVHARHRRYHGEKHAEHHDEPAAARRGLGEPASPQGSWERRKALARRDVRCDTAGGMVGPQRSRC